MLTLTDFTVSFPDKILIESSGVHLFEGSLTALVGQNGAGKSTLLRAITRLGGKFGGKIEIDGHNLADIPLRDFAHMVSFVPTGRIRATSMTVRQAVALGRAPYTGWMGTLRAQDNTIVNRAMADTGTLHLADRLIDTLSDGEYKSVMTARAIAQDTPLMVMDEPTSFLDLPNRHRLCKLLKSLTESGRTILFSTHEVELAAQYADNILFLHNKHLTLMPASAAPKVIDTMLADAK